MVHTRQINAVNGEHLVFYVLMKRNNAVMSTESNQQIEQSAIGVEEMPQADRYASFRTPSKAEITAHFYTYPIGYYFKKDYYFVATKLLVMQSKDAEARGRIAEALQAIFTEAELMADEAKEFSFDHKTVEPNRSYRALIKSPDAAMLIGAFLKADKSELYVRSALHDPQRRNFRCTQDFALKFSWPFMVQYNAFKLLIMREGRQAQDKELILC
jgi:hypothetical protein